jgi:hypothetical protein
MTGQDQHTTEVDRRVSRPGGISYLHIPAGDLAEAGNLMGFWNEPAR